jgi:hypothetical protein
LGFFKVGIKDNLVYADIVRGENPAQSFFQFFDELGNKPDHYDKIHRLILETIHINCISNSNSVHSYPDSQIEVSIPIICPHCKNPNTKRIKLCKWCGNQIF